MKRNILALSAVLTISVCATSLMSDGHADKAVMAAVKARQSQMNLYAFNLGLLGGMAKGEVEYDAEAAAAAAGNLAALAKLDQSRLWPAGSDTATLGVDVTASLPAIWEAGSTVGEKSMAFTTAALAMEEAAGGGLDSLRGAMGALGKSCGGCHQPYRQKK